MILMRNRNTRIDTSLAKVYKDLMVTRRELIDLKTSISKTIREIKDIDDFRATKKVCYKCGKYNEPALPHNCQPMATIKCPNCSHYFTTTQSLALHREFHHKKCNLCHLPYEEPKDTHDKHLCPNTMISCQCCNLNIQRKDIDHHVSICCYRVCFKCKKNVYLRAYAYHLQECKRQTTKSLITKCKKFPAKKGIKLGRPAILPCSLILDEPK